MMNADGTEDGVTTTLQEAPPGVSAPPAGAAGLTTLDIMAIIPCFKQPGLLAEALESVLTQRGPYRVGGVVVDDGCPYGQTRDVGLSYARRYPDQIVYLRRLNGGLSAARNSGIDFTLAALPNCRSLYMLDADNRLLPDFLNKAQAALDSAPEEIGWIYPDFDFFGFEENYSARGEYSHFMHILENYCEAGSLVARRVFETGLRFDEDMRAGFEDWDFWLRSAQRGFRGRHLPASGFRYRKRAESMLTGSERVRATILGGMRERYRKHLTVPALARLEAAEVPRFAVFRLDEDRVDHVLDPLAAPARSETPVQAQTRFVEAQRTPQSVHFPAFCCFATGPALDMLARGGLLQNIFYQAQIAMRDAHFVAVTVVASGREELALRSVPAPAPAASAREAVLVFARSNLLAEVARDPSPAWIEGLLADTEGGPILAGISVTLPTALVRPAEPVGLPMLRAIEGLRARTQTRSALAADWREEWRRSRVTAHEAYHELTGCGAILPHINRGDGRDIAFMLPLFEFGGVEKVVFGYAAVLRRLGWRPHLFITGAQRVTLLDDQLDVFESVNFFPGDGIEGGDYNKLHLGAPVSGFALWRDPRDAIGLLATMDVVLNTHTLGGHGIMQALRKQGLKTYLGLHLVEKGPYGQPLGNPHIALAYESAYDGFVVISEKLRDWCVGQGVPAAKVMKVLNAPSYQADPLAVVAALAERPHRAGPLRVLYLGRLDVQKGLERLRDMVVQTMGPDIEWRLVGKAVLNDTALDLTTTGIVVEPPAMTGEALTELYAWADCVVLPSRFEGVPLTILEAQRLGCVVLATDVGAVSEIVEDGVDGYLIDANRTDFAIVGDFVARLRQLAAHRALLLFVGQAAARRVGRSRWEDNMHEWLGRLNAALPEAA